MSLKPGESMEKEFVTYFEAAEGVAPITAATTFTLKFVNLDSGDNYKFSQSGVVMNPEAISAVAVSNLNIKDATPQSGWNVPAFSVADPSQMEFSADVSCTNGFFSQPIYAVLFPNEAGVPSISITQLNPILFLSQGETGTVSGTIYFDQAIEGKDYQIVVYKYGASGFSYLNAVCLISIPSSGLDEINGEDGLEIVYDQVSGEVKVVSDAGVSSIKVVSMSGAVEVLPITADGAAASASLGHLPKGIYVVTATDTDGRTQSIKISK